MSGYGRRLKIRSLVASAAGLALMLVAAGAASAAPASPANPGASRVPALPKLGIWTAVSPGMNTESPAPALWVSPAGIGWDVFPRQVGPDNFTYEAVRLNQAGKVIAGPTDIFAIHWGSLQFGPTLLGMNGTPLLIFDGIRGTSGPYSLGCVYGALGGASKWTVEPWTLSKNCVNPVAAAAESNPSAKTLAAAWPGGWATGTGINYRIGVSAIPAASDDKHIALAKATAFPTGMVNDQHGNGHFYVAWAQVFSKPGGRDGIYVHDVSNPGSAVLKAPNSGTATVSADMSPFATLAITNRNPNSGVFIGYCANVSPCHLLLWRMGAATKPIPVPGSASAYGVSIAQGPLGRIWVAWYNSASNKVFVTRTNKADTRFGAVESYATPCVEHGLLGLGGTPLQRLDIGMQCVNKAHLQAEQFTTQVSAGLTLGIPGPVHVGSGVTVKITVTDAGDPVKGATVSVAGKSATTNAAGQAFIHLPSGTKAGDYTVTAHAANYRTATGTLVVKK